MANGGFTDGGKLTNQPNQGKFNPGVGWIPSKPATPVSDPSPTTDAGKKKLVAGIVAGVLFVVGRIVDIPGEIEIGNASVTMVDLLTVAALFVMGLFSKKQATASADAE